MRDFLGRFLKLEPVKPTASTGIMERAMGIETTFEAWEANLKARNARSLPSMRVRTTR
jgi:hypothetical protein